MSLLCWLGWHRPKPMARWNDGYYFSSCEDCGRDLVRTPFESWHVPYGHRVVWSPTPPPNRPTAMLVPEPAGAGANGSADRDRKAGEEHAAVAVGDPAPAAAAVTGGPAAAPATGQHGRSDTPAIGDVLTLLREEEAAATAADTGAEPRTEAERKDGTGLPDAAKPAVLELTADDLATSEAPPLELDRTYPDLREDNDAGAGAVSPVAQTLEERPVDAPAQPVAPSEAAVPASRAARDYFDDFMAEPDERSDGSFAWVGAVGSEPPLDRPPQAAAGPPLSAGAHEVRAQGAEEAPPWAEHQPSDRPAWSAWSGRQLGEAWKRFVGADSAGSARQALGVAVGAFLLLVAAALIQPRGVGRETARPEPSPPALANDRSAAPGSIEPAQAERAFVAARLLNCRESPALGARSKRILSRGEEVLVLAREPTWASIAHDGRQCWVNDRYLSPAPPL